MYIQNCYLIPEAPFLAALLVKLHKNVFLPSGKLLWDFNIDLDILVSPAIAVEVGYTFSLHPEDGSWLRACRYLELCAALQCRHLNLCAERCLSELDRDTGKYVVPIPLECVMRLDMEHDIQVTWLFPSLSCFSFSRYPQLSPGHYSCRYLHLELPVLLHASFAVANRAGS